MAITALRKIVPFSASPNNTRVAFQQRGGQGDRGGYGSQAKAGDKKDVSNGSGRDSVSRITRKPGDGPRTNSKGESYTAERQITGHTTVPS